MSDQAALRRGDIWWADLLDAGRRPVLILTRDDALPHLSNVTVAPMTRTVRGVRSEVELSPRKNHVPTRCAVSLDNVQTIPQIALDAPITSLDSDTMNAVAEALHYALELPY